MAFPRGFAMLFTIFATILLISTSVPAAGCRFATFSGSKLTENVLVPEVSRAINSTIHRLNKLPKSWNTDFCRPRCLRRKCRRMLRTDESAAPLFLRALFHDHQACALDGSLRYELNRPENVGLFEITEKTTNAAYKCGCSVADTFALCAGMGIPYRGGPGIRMRWGHVDTKINNPPGHLPPPFFGKKSGADVLRKMMHQYDDKTIVLLSSAHTIGHANLRKDGKVVGERAFTRNPKRFTNEYFRNLRGYYLTKKTPKGTFQFPSDLVLVKDKVFRKYVMRYAKNTRLYFKDFRAAMYLVIGDYSTCGNGPAFTRSAPEKKRY